ncbi:MAG: EAL domain-containing protein [Alphaproteobacteria bacterium]|nr:EAL domain-containing protein [Alphaproteobacteria bacterium]
MRTNTIRLGLMPPLTGLVQLYGSEILRAARIACEEVNERGGVLDRELELIVEDDGSLPGTAVPAALRLIDEHRCAAIIGNLLSNSRIAVAAQVAEPRRVPYLNFSFYEGSISSRYFFHFAALPNQQIDLMIPAMTRRYGLKMFFAGNNYEWPRGSIDAAKRTLIALDGDILGEEYLSIGASRAEIDDLLGRVARSGADVFVPYFAGSDQIALLTRFTELGLKDRMAVVMGHYDEAMVGHLSPEVRDGFYSSNTYFMSVETRGNRNYLDRLARQPGVNGLWPSGNGVLTNFGEGTYVCVHAYARAVAIAGTTDAEAVVDALEKIEVEGPQGRVTMDPDTHHAYVNAYLARCRRDGSFEIVESFGRLPPVIPERYRKQAGQARLHESPASPQSVARVAAEMAAAIDKLGAARQILAIADMAVIATDERGTISEANRIASDLFGYRPEELLGLSVHQLVPPHFRQRHAELIERFVAGDESERRMSRRQEISGYRKDGSFFPMEASIAKVRAGRHWLLVVTMQDVSARKAVEEELTRRATHDPLTGLANRALIRERLANALQRSKRQGSAVAVLMIDLDGFKLVNDTHGHGAGDALLKAIGSRLIGLVRPGDTVARLGGDEFVVLCEQAERPESMSVVAERILESLRQPIKIDDAHLVVTASIGVSIGRGAIHSADELLQAADTAMYAAKESGRDCWRFHSDELQERARERLTITQGLRHAVDRGEFSPRFQPIVALESGRIVGAELLLRWHPPGGEISPSTFIPIAEATNAILPIGAWVFREGCRAEVDWRRRWGGGAPYVSINLSIRQLVDEKFVSTFTRVLRDTGADPTRIILEVTETTAMTGAEGNLRQMLELADLGFRIAIDDFGTGYSSLAQLSRLPVGVLKIDRAFIDGIDRQKEHRAIVRAVIGLGGALGMTVVAEGVETRSQLGALSEDGCDQAQGYLFARPLETAAFLDFAAASIAKG